MEDKEITREEVLLKRTAMEWYETLDREIPGWLLEECGLLDEYKGPGPWPNGGKDEDVDQDTPE